MQTTPATTDVKSVKAISSTGVVVVVYGDDDPLPNIFAGVPT